MVLGVNSARKVSLDQLEREIREFQEALQVRLPNNPDWMEFVNARIQVLNQMFHQAREIGWKPYHDDVRTVEDVLFVTSHSFAPIMTTIQTELEDKFRKLCADLNQQVKTDTGKELAQVDENTPLSKKATDLVSELEKTKAEIWQRCVL